MYHIFLRDRINEHGILFKIILLSVTSEINWKSLWHWENVENIFQVLAKEVHCFSDTIAQTYRLMFQSGTQDYLTT